jgi:quinol monooxygenase YgiN
MSDLGQLYTSGSWITNPGKEDEFRRAWAEFAQWSSEHKLGVGTPLLLQDLDTSNRFLSFGPWDSKEQIAAWRATPEFAAFLAKAKELCEEVKPSTLRLVAHG